MITPDIYSFSPFISSVCDLLKSRGITLEFGTDFLKYTAIINSHPKRHDISPKFRFHDQTLNKATGFWIIGRNLKGELVHTQAVRTIDMEGLSFASYMANRFHDFIPYAIKEIESGYFPGPKSHKMKGVFCYHGELWLVHPGIGGNETSTLSLLTRIAKAISLTKWSPDYYFAFGVSRNVYRGLAAKSGYLHTEPNSLVWVAEGENELRQAWAAWVTKAEISYLISVTQRAMRRADEMERASSNENTTASAA